MTLAQTLAGMRRRLSPAAPRPPCIVQAQGRLSPGLHAKTFAMVCGPGFDQRVPNAATTSRTGWCGGFESLGVPYRLVSSQSLAAELDGLPDPMVWISGSDHATLDGAALQALKRHRHAVLVDPAFDGADSWYPQHKLPALAVRPGHVARVLSTQPRFVFTIASETGFDFYAHWWRGGVPLVSLPLAFDTTLDADPPATGGGDGACQGPDLVFVGGYWRYKARQFALYLKPYADRLDVYGYTRWPWGRYGGQLQRAHEAATYRSARLSPVINEPHVPLMGIDINERVFKVAGAGGMALTDATPAYRDWFDNDELLVPRSLAEYRELADAVLAGEIDTRAWRRRGQAAVLQRHTYRHRAAAFLAQMTGGAA